jgi:uncharacterized protein YqjF (DUF2071 family)
LPDAIPIDPPVLPRADFTQQHWRSLTFVHWPVNPESVAHLYPRGTRPMAFGDGATHVGLAPFAMSEVALGLSRPIPYFGSFLETHVTLYSTDGDGRHGVLFRSIETSRLAVVRATRVGMGSPCVPAFAFHDLLRRDYPAS